jgi:hypothetical protein
MCILRFAGSIIKYATDIHRRNKLSRVMDEMLRFSKRLDSCVILRSYSTDLTSIRRLLKPILIVMAVIEHKFTSHILVARLHDCCAAYLIVGV